MHSGLGNAIVGEAGLVNSRLREAGVDRFELKHCQTEETMTQIPAFEIPEQLRELTERNIEQARVAYSQLMDAMVKSTGMWITA